MGNSKYNYFWEGLLGNAACSYSHAAMFTLHWKAFAEWLIQEEKDIDYISVLASNCQLLVEALSKTDIFFVQRCN